MFKICLEVITNSVLSDVWNGKVDAFGHNAGLSSQLNDNNSAYQKALSNVIPSTSLKVIKESDADSSMFDK